MEPGDLWDEVSNCRCGDRLKTLEQRARKQHQRCLAHSLVGTPNYIAPEVLLRKGRCLRYSPEAFHTPAQLEAILAPELWNQRTSESLQPQISKTLNIPIVTVYPRKHVSLSFGTALTPSMTEDMQLYASLCSFLLWLGSERLGGGVDFLPGTQENHCRTGLTVIW